MTDEMKKESKPEISNEAVQAATGKKWEEWFAILDGIGAQEMTHQKIVAYLRDEHSVAPWWQQSVTNTYEKYIGRREKHEMPEGFQISRSRTLFAPLSELWNAWYEESARKNWLLDEVQVRKATPEKTLRLTWPDGTPVDVSITAKGETKSQVTVQHNKLANAEQAGRMKDYWSDALDKLERYLSRSPLA